MVRWGGEEFLVYAPQLSAAQIDVLAERVLRSVGERPMVISGGATVSIG